MKLRKRTENKSKNEKKGKPAVVVKKEKVNKSVKKKKKVRTPRSSKKKKASNKKAAETVEVIEIPPVVKFAIKDVVSAMKGATKEELELKEECTIIFECNQCESFFRSLGSYLNHKTTFCRKNLSGSNDNDEDLVHQVYSWPFLGNVKEEIVNEVIVKEEIVKEEIVKQEVLDEPDSPLMNIKLEMEEEIEEEELYAY